MRETLDLAKYLNTEWANFYCAMAYPGSPLYKMAKERKWPTPDDNDNPGWIGYSQHAYDCMPLPTDTLHYTEVLDFRDNAFDEYFTSPAYLDMIRCKFGQQVVEHVREMTSHSIRRRHRELAKTA